MRKFKKITAICLSMAMVASMVGCDKKDKTTEDTTGGVIEITTEGTTEAPEEEEELALFDGQEVFLIDFEDGGTGGFTSYVNTGGSTIANEDGKMKIAIDKVGTLDYANQAYKDGFVMYRDCVYTFEFDVYSDIEREMQWRIQINGGDYHPYAIDNINISSEVTHVSTEFTMSEESDPAPRLCFNMGMFEGMSETPHNVYIDNIKLTVKDCSNAQQIKKIPEAIATKVNQIGYSPDDVKTVIVNDSKETGFVVVNTATNEEVHSGTFSEVMFDKASGDIVRYGDFTDVKEPGTYKVIADMSGESYEFVIGEGIYDDAYKDIVLMLYSQRCGCVLDDSIMGEFAHEECHMGDAIVYENQSVSKDVTGGWHDAGDYGRYVVPGAKTVQDLFLAYEDYGCDFDDLGIPESGNKVPDLLDEARYELEWMFKMQDENGGVYHKVTALVFPETVLAIEETDQLYLSPISYAATCDFAAVMAKASVLYKNYDEAFANKCLEVSKKAYEYSKEMDKSSYKNPEEIVTGEYPDGKLDDETLWAAAELYLATKEAGYLEDVMAVTDAKMATSLGWADIAAYAYYDLAKTDIEGSAEIKELAKGKITAEADSIIEKCEKDGYFMALGVKYPWGSNMTVANNGMLLLMASQVSGNGTYKEYASKQLDYLFGLNSVGYSFITGYGDFAPDSTHHRPSQVLEVTLPGMLVGGPDSDLEDPYANAVLYGFPAAKCYVDNEQSFSCNEITIYWNSPLVYLLSGLK